MKNLTFFYIIFIVFLSCNEKHYNLNPIDQVSFQKLYDLDSTIQLVDVRTDQEFTEGFIPGAIHINFNEEDFLEKSKLMLDSKKPIYLYCKTGNRSAKAGTKLLLTKKFENVYYIKGGYTYWNQKLKKK